MSSPNPVRLTVIDYEAIPVASDAEVARAKACVARAARDAADAALLLDAVFGKPREPAPPCGRRSPASVWALCVSAAAAAEKEGS